MANWSLIAKADIIIGKPHMLFIVLMVIEFLLPTILIFAGINKKEISYNVRF